MKNIFPLNVPIIPQISSSKVIVFIIYLSMYYLLYRNPDNSISQYPAMGSYSL